MKLLDLLFGKTYLAYDEPEDPDKPLKEYVKSLRIKSDFVRIDGPFLCEKYALKYLDLYKELLQKTYYRINICISRPLALISSDSTFETMDNPRIEFEIPPYNHRFELFANGVDFVVIGVDGNILLNKTDADKIKTVLRKFPLTVKELKSQNLI